MVEEGGGAGAVQGRPKEGRTRRRPLEMMWRRQRHPRLQTARRPAEDVPRRSVRRLRSPRPSEGEPSDGSRIGRGREG